MDDLLKSLPTEEEATKLALELIDLVSSGGFRLTKFMSNSRNVLAQLPPEYILCTLREHQPFNFHLDSLPLGVLWTVEQDSLEMKVVTKQLPPTKRGILKQIATIYGPLGLAWKAELPTLASLSVPRCYLSGADYRCAQLHIFADASELAFGAAAYWRFRTMDKLFCCAFILGKRRH